MSCSEIEGQVVDSNKELIAEEENIEAVRELRQAGFKVHALDLSEFVKGAEV